VTVHLGANRGVLSSFYLEPVYRLVPIFNPFLMTALLVSFHPDLLWIRGLFVFFQIFKVVVPYVMLSVAFATLNARLRLPPFSLFLVALTLMDGMTVTFFFNVTDTGELDIVHVCEKCTHWDARIVVGNRSIYQFLLHHINVAGVVGWYLFSWWGVDGGCLGIISASVNQARIAAWQTTLEYLLLN
jgi:hypothetical protein